MKRIACLSALIACMACNDFIVEQPQTVQEAESYGSLSVSIEYEQMKTKTLTDYTTELNEERVVKNVAVFVFDKATGNLNAFQELDAVGQDCQFTVTAGEKTICAVANGPDFSSVTTLNQLMQTVDDLSATEILTDGFVMTGVDDCLVEAGEIAEPVIQVRRLVSRVVLKKVTNSVAPQYGSMTVDCVYLGNANTKQTYAGWLSVNVNPGGYEDAEKTKPIGKDGIVGSCPGYMYRAVGADILVGESSSEKYHMYCQPSKSNVVTCMYILTTIGGSQYYYRVPLQNGLLANTTYSVEVEIVNLGSDLPPDGDIQKGDIKATVSVAGWDAGDKYVVEF